MSIDITAAELPYTVNEIQIPLVGILKQIGVTKGDTISLTCKAASRDVSSGGIFWSREDGTVSFNDALAISDPNVS